jgi:hypothetical protein
MYTSVCVVRFAVVGGKKKKKKKKKKQKCLIFIERKGDIKKNVSSLFFLFIYIF